MAWIPADVYFVVQVAMRKRKAAIDATDTAAQTRAETSLTALDSDWLSTVWVDWQTAGYPAIL